MRMPSRAVMRAPICDKGWAERPHRLRGAQHVLAFKYSLNTRAADRERAQDERAMRNRLVARDAAGAAKRARCAGRKDGHGCAASAFYRRRRGLSTARRRKRQVAKPLPAARADFAFDTARRSWQRAGSRKFAVGSAEGPWQKRTGEQNVSARIAARAITICAAIR